jgi:hypothetical protein
MSQSFALPAMPPSPTARERRDAARYACRIETEFYALGEIVARPRRGCVVNISSTGMTLVVENAVGRHTLIGVELRDRSRTRSFLLVGRVVRALSYGESWMIGCSFDRPLAHDELEPLL